MVRGSRVLLKEMGISKALSDFLACPLSKQPLRLSPETDSLISDALGASYPIVDGIPCLVPKDGKLLMTDDASKHDTNADSSAVNNGHMGGLLEPRRMGICEEYEPCTASRFWFLLGALFFQDHFPLHSFK